MFKFFVRQRYEIPKNFRWDVFEELLYTDHAYRDCFRERQSASWVRSFSTEHRIFEPKDLPFCKLT